MKNVKTFVFILCTAMFVYSASSQEPFSNCAAAFLNKKIVVDEYSPKGKCRLDASAKGVLTVCTAELSPENATPVKEISFMVAIRDGNTKTMMMYSDKAFSQVPVEKILAKCRKGDSIVLLTKDNEYALPHNEILVE